MSASSIGRRLASGEWTAAEYRVYGIGGAPITWHQLLLAACLAGPAVASHRSAARLWGFGIDGVGDIVEVAALRHRRRHSSGVHWHESQRLDERYIATVDGIPVTTPIRTIVDLAVVLDADALEQTLYTAMRLRLVSIEAIERTLEDLGELRLGRKRMREVLRRARSHERPPESDLETPFLQLLRSAELPLPIAQLDVRDEAGDLVGRADFAYPQHRLLIELDSSRWHSIGIDRERDIDRDRRMRELGHRVIRVTWSMVHREPALLVARFRAELGLS